MKKVFILIILGIVLSSCGRTVPVLNSENKPFIVNKIKYFDKNFASYYSNYYSEIGLTFRANSVIIAPIGWYNIQDTIKLINPNIK